MKDLGYFKGEKCNRNGCNGIIDEHEKEGECICHINPPCSYCTTQTSYCPKCGWSASEEEYEYHLNRKQEPFVYKHKTEEERFNELKDGEFGYIYVASGSSIICRIRGKHPNMKPKEIYE